MDSKKYWKASKIASDFPNQREADAEGDANPGTLPVWRSIGRYSLPFVNF